MIGHIDYRPEFVRNYANCKAYNFKSLENPALLKATSNIAMLWVPYLGRLPTAAGYSYIAGDFVGAGLALCGILFCAHLFWMHKRKAEVVFP